MSSDTPNDTPIEKIKRDPDFHALRRRRSRFAWTLTALIVLIYVSFILLVAFAPGFLATPIGGGTTTIGIPLGVGVIVVAFVLTGLYVYRANTDFDVTTERIVKRVS